VQGGDITNEVPNRIIVTVDTFIRRQPAVKKVLGIIPFATEEVVYDRLTIQRLWFFSARTGKLLELAGFDMTDKEIQQVMDDLDNLGTNPFNYAKAYSVVADLVSELPYRPEVSSVVDIPQRSLMYGSWALDLGRI